MPEPGTDLTIIIPNYNTRQLLHNCIASIYTHTTGITFEIICLDDNSHDGSADMVAHDFPLVKLIRNHVNQNYVKNNNRGMSMSRARYACLLNSDTLLINNAFKSLVEFMDSHPEVAACGPKLLNPDGTVQHCIRRFAGFKTLVLQAFNWHKLSPMSSTMRKFYALDTDYSREQQVDSIGTTAFVIRRSTWEHAGMLDERFCLYVVDWAYNYMLKQCGYKVYYTPCAEIVHFGSQSMNQAALRSIRQLHDALITFNEHYNYFGSGKLSKLIVREGVRVRCWIKLAEYYFGRDKRVVKGPGAPALRTGTRAT